MDSKIKEWIQLAQKISKYLLHPTEDSKQQVLQKWTTQRDNREEILHELQQPEYYAQKAKRHQEIQEKYSWDHFIISRQQRRQRLRLQIIGYAASVLILLAAGSALWIYNHPTPQPALAGIPQINPGSTKALLILDNGKEITLDNQLTLTEKDGTVIQNNESGEISYNNQNKADTVIRHHILRIPRGGEYRLTLTDGTKVWLNSESELSYPTQFAVDKREVFLKGEAYFEIAHNKQQPFFVNSNQLQIHATGTAFDVIAYQDEPEMKVILVEGGVNIEENQNIISRLTPDHQFALNKATQQFTITHVDPRTATAWKNGSFFFNDEQLSSIVRKLSRWYNIDIECNNPYIQQYKFSGEIRKYEDATQVLNMLKLTNEITYTVQPDKKIIIYSTE